MGLGRKYSWYGISLRREPITFCLMLADQEWSVYKDYQQCQLSSLALLAKFMHLEQVQ